MAGDIVPIELGLTDGNAYTLWALRWRGTTRSGRRSSGSMKTYTDSTTSPTSSATSAAPTTSTTSSTILRGRRSSNCRPTSWCPTSGTPMTSSASPSSRPTIRLRRTSPSSRTHWRSCASSARCVSWARSPSSSTATRSLGAVTAGTRNFVGRDGQDLWVRIGRLIAKHWDDVIDALDDVLETPDVDDAVAAAAEAELAAAASARTRTSQRTTISISSVTTVTTVTSRPASLVDDDDDDTDTEAAELIEGEIEEDDFWVNVGIDPIQITTSDGEYLSLRCYLDDEPVFLGKDGTIFVFPSIRSITRFLAEDDDHDLAKVSTFDDVRVAATDGVLEFEVYDDNVYVLPGLAGGHRRRPRRIDGEQLDLAVELTPRRRRVRRRRAVGEALSSTTPLGWFIDYATNPDPKRLAPSPPFDNESGRSARWSTTSRTASSASLNLSARRNRA